MTLLRTRWLSCCLLAFSCIFRLYGQLPDYHAQVFDERHGLRTDMYHVIKDDNEFTWIVYNDRVQRFDGVHVTEFFIGEGLHTIFNDHLGRIWLSSNTKVYRFENDKTGFKQIAVDSTEELSFGSVFQFPDQPVWVLTQNGFYAFDEKRSIFRPVTDEKYKIKTPVQTRRLRFRAVDHTVFYVSRDTIWSLETNTGKSRFIPFRNLHKFYALNADQLIVSSWRAHTFHCDFNTREVQPIIPHTFLEKTEDDFLVVNAILNLDGLHYLLATTKGLLSFNAETRAFALKKIYYKGQPLSNEGKIMDMYLDRQRKVWACSEYTMMTFDPFGSAIGLLRNKETDPTISFSNHIRGMVADESGNLWLASLNGIIYWDLRQNKFQPYFAVEGATDRMNHPSIRGIGYDGVHVIIGQTNRGVWLYNPKTKKYRRPIYEDGDAGEMVRRKLERDFIDQICKLHNGHHIIVGRDGCYLLEADTYLVRHIPFPGSKENLNFGYEDRFHQVWLGTGKGLYCLDSNLVFKMQIKEGIGNAMTRSLYQWDDHEYILGAQGLYRIRITDGHPEIDTLNTFFNKTFIHTIIRDKLDRLWLATDEGLYLYEWKNNYIEHFDRYDHVQGDFYYQNCSYRGDQDILFLGGTNGINYFHPEEIEFRKDSLHISLMRVSVNQDDTSYMDRAALFSLRPDENNVEIEYIAPFYGNPNKLQYRYQLQGLSDAWNHAGNNNTVRFTSLQPGEYIFKVAASINGLDWYECRESLAFSIAYPFWRTWWFLTCCVIGISTLIFYFFRKRIDSIRQKEIIKRDYEKRIAEVEMHALRAQMNPHFMFNSLNSINNFILKNDPDNASGYLTKFSRLMRLILDNSRSEWVLLEHDLKALELYIELEIVRFDNVFSYEIIVSPEIDVATTSIPPMIIQPYVENAIWHGLLHRKEPGGKLTVRLWREQQYLHICIEDNGVGREEAKRLKSKTATRHKSHGMKITAERIEIVNRVYNVDATVKIEDIAGPNGSVGGTSVLLTLADKKYDSHHSG